MAGSAALDMGSGSGYLTRLLRGGFPLVVGTDICHAVLCGQTYKTDNLVCCDGADALRRGSFDLIVCNMPYLATDTVTDAATDGGPGGIPVPLGLIRSAVPCLSAGGRLVFVTSSLSDYRALIGAAASEGLAPRIVARKRLFFEELIVVEARAAGRGGASAVSLPATAARSDGIPETGARQSPASRRATPRGA